MGGVRKPDIHITGIGWVLLVAFPCLLVVSFIGPRSVQGWAFAGCTLIALVVVLSLSPLRERKRSPGQLSADRFVRRWQNRDGGSQAARAPEASDEAGDAGAWQRERERERREERGG